MDNLRHTQKWVQGVITHPDGVYKGATETLVDGEQWKIDTIVSPSINLTSQQRIGIYHSSYFARLIECFRSEYNGLLNALGSKLFEHLTWCFLQAHPSTSYTLNNLGKLFPEYLETTLKENLEGETPDWWQVFIIDMAKFERKYTEVYNGDGHEKILSNDVFGLEPSKLSPAVTTLQLQFPISKCIGQFREDETNFFPSQEPSNYVFTRQTYRVKVYLIYDDEWNALQYWINNSTETCPTTYEDKWKSRGIGYS